MQSTGKGRNGQNRGGGRGLKRKVDLIVNDCRDILNREDLIEFEACPTLPDYPKRWVRNKRTGLQCVHEFCKDKSIDEQYPEVIEKYQRRIKRMYESIENAKKVLFVFFTRKEECERAIAQTKKISKKFPQKNINWLFIMHDDSIKDNSKIIVNQRKNIETIFYRQFIGNTDTLNSETIQKILSPITLGGKKCPFILRLISCFIPNKKLRRKIRSFDFNKKKQTATV